VGHWIEGGKVASETTEDQKEPLVAVKLIGEGKIGKGKDGYYGFTNLASALKAFLQNEIFQLHVIGQDAWFQFSTFRAEISLENTRDIMEFWVDAPIVYVKVWAWDSRAAQNPPFSSLAEGFKSFLERGLSLQIYEHIQSVVVPGVLETAKNYMINLDWLEDRRDGENGPSDKVAVHLHNVDVKDNHSWRMDYQYHRKGTKLILTPHFGGHYQMVLNPFYKN
jgi:hypothetical protein